MLTFTVQRDATLDEMRGKWRDGERVAYRHATFETGYMRAGQWVDVQRSNSTAAIHFDAAGAYVLRKGQREALVATYYEMDGCKPFLSSLRADYLK